MKYRSTMLGALTACTHRSISEVSIYVPAIYNATPCGNSLATTLEATSGFDTLVQALQAANLYQALATSGEFTIFATTDAAFANLPSGALEQLLANPSGQLTQILLFHIVPGRVEASDLTDGMQIRTQQGGAIHIETGCEIKVNGATIVTPNIITTNGIIHAIDTVLLPPPD